MQPKQLSSGKERLHASIAVSVPPAAPVGLCRAVPRRDGPRARALYGAGGTRGVRPSRALSVAGGVAGLYRAGVGHRADTISKGPVARGGQAGGTQTGGPMRVDE